MKNCLLILFACFFFLTIGNEQDLGSVTVSIKQTISPGPYFKKSLKYFTVTARSTSSENSTGLSLLFKSSSRNSKNLFKQLGKTGYLYSNQDAGNSPENLSDSRTAKRALIITTKKVALSVLPEKQSTISGSAPPADPRRYPSRGKGELVCKVKQDSNYVIASPRSLFSPSSGMTTTTAVKAIGCAFCSVNVIPKGDSVYQQTGITINQIFNKSENIILSV